MPSDNPILEFANAQGAMILDGGLATTLEAYGNDLNDPLWSAKVLLESPNSLYDAHRAFLDAGADCIATGTYQATLEGLDSRGVGPAEAAALMREAVRLATTARADFWQDRRAASGTESARLRPLVAASIGPYGAFLADGSEYHGDYGLTVSELAAFHEPRWTILADGDADVVAFETVPSGPEVQALAHLIADTPHARAWISMSCEDSARLHDGSSLEEAARICDAVPGVIGIGVNCVRPRQVEGMLRTLVAATAKPLLAYPNSGERYDATSKAWSSDGALPDWTDAAPAWVALGAKAVGGCCRTTPVQIAALRTRLLS